MDSLVRMNKDLYIVLMAGGAGTRFWPYSRKMKPKQFLDVLGLGKTLIQSTYERFLPFCPRKNIFIVTTEELRDITKAQLNVDDEHVLTEPMGKNTAPCIAYSCYKIKKKSPHSIIIVSPSDHLILNEEEFQNTICQSVAYATGQDKLITLGISPRQPETGYGYIQFIESKNPFKKVKMFVEKPNVETAQKFIEHGDFVWNSGIFIWSTEAIISAIKKYQPKIAEAFESIYSTFYTSQEKEGIQNVYSYLEPISIDHGVLEKTDNVYVCISNFTWSDLGSWHSLYAIQKKDIHGNVIDAHAMVYETYNSMIKGSKDKLFVVQGLKDYFVGEFDNVVIVCKKNEEHMFRKFVADLKINPKGTDYL